MNRFKKILAACLLAASLASYTIAIPVYAHNWDLKWFLIHYNNQYFDLSVEPEREMTIEEFIAVIYAYSYYGDGSSDTSVSLADKNGNQPSEWCAKYIRAEVGKGTVSPKSIAWSDKATIAFAAQFLARAKGKYSYERNNSYHYTGAESVSAEDKMYIDVAIDSGLVKYTSPMNVSQAIKRKDALLYEIPSSQVSVKPTVIKNQSVPKTVHVYFPNNYWDFEKATSVMEQMVSVFTSDSGENLIPKLDAALVTFDCGYVTGERANDGNKYLYDEVVHDDALKMYNRRDSRITEDVQQTAIRKLQQMGGKALFGVNNFSTGGFSLSAVENCLKDAESINTLATEIMQVVQEYNFDGVNMGFEITSDVSSQLRKNYSDFISVLANKLHSQGKILLVTTGSYFKQDDESRALYDYGIIGENADYVHVILYDDYPDTSFAYTSKYGAMSNFTRIKRVMNYCSERMSPSKLLLGMGTIGIDYNINGYSATDIDYSDVQSLMQKYGITQVSGEENSEAYFKYTDGNYNHIVYFESLKTMKDRIEFAGNLGCGLSFYCLSGKQTEHDVWNYLKEQYSASGLSNFEKIYSGKNISFADVKSTDWYFKNVSELVNYGIMNGKSSQSFDPSGKIKLSEAIKAAAVIHNIYNGSNGSFNQQYGSAWYDVYVAYAIENGIINVNDFRDYNAEATRAQIAYIFSNAIGKSEFNTINESRVPGDLSQSEQYRDNIMLLYRAGILTGDSVTYNFRPTDSITRAETASIALRIINKSYRVN